jgi:hypothetical protein
MTFLHTELFHVSDTKSTIWTNPDLLAVCRFSAVGLLLTIIIAHAFPISEIANLFALVD